MREDCGQCGAMFAVGCENTCIFCTTNRVKNGHLQWDGKAYLCCSYCNMAWSKMFAQSSDLKYSNDILPIQTIDNFT